MQWIVMILLALVTVGTLFLISFVTLLAVLGALFLFLVFPAPRRHLHRETLKGATIAHRGLHDATRPENSLPAFEAAAAAGHIIELDIHLTADNQVVVFHDDTLTRVCGVDARIEEKTLAELKALRLKDSDETIPTLTECLALVDKRVPLLIEFKLPSKDAAPLCSAADAILSDYDGVYFVQSFYPTVLQWYKKHRPEICRGQLAAPFFNESFVHFLLGCMLFNVIARPDFVSYDHVGAKHVCRRLCTLLGAQPLGWTFHSQQEIDQHLGDFEGFIFEGFSPKL